MKTKIEWWEDETEKSFKKEQRLKDFLFPWLSMGWIGEMAESSGERVWPKQRLFEFKAQTVRL